MIAQSTEHVLAFGTDGIRGNAEQFPFTDDALFAFGKALACWAQKKYQKKNPKILLGADTRISGLRIKKALVQGFASEGIVLFDAGILPTPAVCQLIVYDQSFDAGIVISASHNPYHDNGIKIFDARRCKLTPQDEKEIIELFDQYFIPSAYDQQPGCPVIPIEDSLVSYHNKIISLFNVGFLKNVKVVLDCAHGATSIIAPAIFRALGAEVVTIAASPNGMNINDQCGALHPELLSKTVLEQKADCGFAFDGDGDRILAVGRQGEQKDGDDIIALLLGLSRYKDLPTVVGTVMSNQGYENYLVELGKKLIRTSVGDKYVAAKLEEEGLPLGGELSGHIIIKDYLTTGDGIFVALKVLEAVITHNNWDMKTFEKYPQVLINVPIAHKQDLSMQPFVQIIEDHKKLLGTGRVIVRYSGTEPLLRVMIEAATLDLASAVANDLAYVLQKTLSNSL